ncbi:membrane protein [Actinoplanes sp. SE50]|nr:Transmembrane and TPR repeat-containing protein 4 [Actinoplanes sp. SE50/110]ATO87319.1 membrane protein [Actinoplanes sp. SE50]SLM04737.1 membrane protein [Actinoplanes sp. SE50/110]
MEPDPTPEEHRQRALLLADLGRYDEAADEIAAGLSVAPGGTAGGVGDAASGAASGAPGGVDDLPGGGIGGLGDQASGAPGGADDAVSGAAGGRVGGAGNRSGAADSASGADTAELLATLARIHLVAEQPVEALAAADRAAAARPVSLTAHVVRAMALADNRRYAEAAQVAGEILRAWPEDAYAQRTGAALLSESRNGQEALNAAWNGVRVAPGEAEAHLVLAVVAARLRLFDLAQRAYGEALDLDPAIGDAGQDVGIVRLERRRWARALEELAEEASLTDADGFPEERAPARAGVVEPPAVSLPRRAVLDVSADSMAAVVETIRYGANGTLVAAVVTAAMTVVSSGISRVWAGLIGFLVFVAVVLWFRSRLTEPAGPVLARLRSTARPLAAAWHLSLAGPLFLLAYAVVGGLPTLIAGMLVAGMADLIVLIRRR